MEFEEEQFFTCPYCLQQVSILLDLSVASQSYIEDCEVCCNPIQFSYQSSDQEVHSFSASQID